MFRAFTHWLLRSNTTAKTQFQKRRRTVFAKPCLEALEERVVPAVTIVPGPNGPGVLYTINATVGVAITPVTFTAIADDGLPCTIYNYSLGYGLPAAQGISVQVSDNTATLSGALLGHSGYIDLLADEPSTPTNPFNTEGGLLIFISAPDPTTPTLTLNSLAYTQQGGVQFQYAVAPTNLPQATSLKLSYATGPALSDVIIGSPPISATSVSAAGQKSVTVPASAFGSPPKGASYLVLSSPILGTDVLPIPLGLYVTSTGDEDLSTITLTDQNAEPLSLRAAIELADLNPALGPITFNPFVFPHNTTTAISLNSPLPALTKPMTIDGLAQPFAAPYNPTVVLDGSGIDVSKFPTANGLDLEKGSNGSTIEGLIVGGFGGNGILINGSMGNIIADNWIGVNKPNGGNGIEINNSSKNQIGGTALPGNIISGNKDNGIFVNQASNGNIIENNAIGTASDRVSPLGNGSNGIQISGAGNNNVIGDPFTNNNVNELEKADGNIIAYNGNDGVLINNLNQGNSILSNSIYSNVNVAIHVGSGDGPRPNITGGAQNYPLISPPTLSGTTTTLQVTLNSTASADFAIQIFAVSVPDFASATSPGSCRYVKTVLAPTDASGNYDGSVSFVFTKAPNEFYIGTATNSETHNTSQFSVPADPLLFVPGIFASMPSTSNYNAWLTQRGIGLSPITNGVSQSMLLDPLLNSYADTIQTLINQGYVLGNNLLEAVYDWRLPVGPPTISNGVVTGIDGNSITSEFTSGSGTAPGSVSPFQYGVDYFGYWLATAVANWQTDYPGLTMPAVDVICHSTGGLVVRTYIQSAAYGASYVDNHGVMQTLPQINNLIMMGVPNEGAAGPFEPLNNDWSRSPGDFVVLRPFFSDAYKEALAGATISGPNSSNPIINKGTFTVGNDPPTSDASQEMFIQQYCPTLNALLSTYPFITNPVGKLVDTTVYPNTYLTNLNQGQLGGSPTFFASKVNHLFDIYGTDQSTPTAINEEPDGYTITSLAGLTISGGKYAFVSYPVGDGTVPQFSAAPNGLPGTDTKISFAGLPNIINLEPRPGITHTGMFSNKDINQLVIQNLGQQISIDNVATGLENSNAGALLNSAQYITTVNFDPVQGFLVDAKGNRLGYSQATGPVTEIPGSQWYGGENGYGIITSPLALPVHLELTGAGGSYDVSVAGVEGNTTLGVETSGTLALGAPQTIAVPFQVIPQPAIGSLSVAGGPTTGGTVVTITGTNLSNATEVDFGSLHITNFSSDTATAITLTTPSGVAGTVDVRVITPGGTSAIHAPADQFTFGTLVVTGTAANDVFRFTAGSPSIYSVNGVTQNVPAGFSTIAFIGNGGKDHLVMADLATGANIVSLTPNKAVMTNGAFAMNFSFFGISLVYNFGHAGDTANLSDSAGNDVFYGAGTYAFITGAGYENIVSGFGTINAKSNAGSDVAYLVGQAGGANTLTATPTSAAMQGTGYKDSAFSFRGGTVSYANGANDVADLFDSAGGANVFTANPTVASFAGNYTILFHHVNAAAASGNNDTALLYDQSGSNNADATATVASFSGATFNETAFGFKTVYAIAAAGTRDTVTAHESSGFSTLGSSTNPVSIGNGSNQFDLGYNFAVIFYFDLNGIKHQL